MQRKLVLLTVVFIGLAIPAYPCDITGTVPADIRGVICKVATSVHGGGAPVNQLTLILKEDVAAAVSAKGLSAKDFMLTLLRSWKNGRGVRVARVEAHYGQVHLATAKTNARGEPTVEFH